MRGLRRAARCYLYARAARSFAPHLVHSHFGETGWQNLPLVRALRVPHIVSFYGVDLSRPDREESWSLRYRDMFDQDVTVLCQGPHMVERIVAHGARRDQVRIFRLGIDIEHLPYRPRNWSGAQPLRVLIAGRFVEKKGIPYAIGALARIASRVPLEVHLVGDANASNRSQAERARIAQAIERGGLTKCITRHGLIPYSALIELAYRCHVFLSPSVHAEDGDTEGGAPIALNEMAASGMPIVTTTHCDIPYALGGTQNALLAPERDADALADLLLKLIEHPDDWRPMLDRARAHVERDYDLVRQGEHLAQIYREVLGRSPKTIH
jgi:colanic acid/amylovoran biosynthesis glycosyltransferase